MQAITKFSYGVVRYSRRHSSTQTSEIL